MFLSLLIKAFVIAQLTQVTHSSGHLCWEFQYSPGSVPEVCGDGTSPLNFMGKYETIIGAPLCDYSGCFISSGEGYFIPVPSTLLKTWTIMMWVFSSH